MVRRCNKCQIEKTADLVSFPASRTFPLGIGYTCRPCERIRGAEYRAKNRDKANAASALSRAKRMDRDPEGFKAMVRGSANKWYHADHERAADAQRRWRKANPEKQIERGNRYRARKLAAVVEMVDYAAIAERDRNVCHICGIEVDLTVGTYHPMARTFDHVIPLARGGEHSMQNVKVAHRLCNTRKRDNLLAFAEHNA